MIKLAELNIVKVATVPKGTGTLAATGLGGPRLVQAAPGKQIPQGATIVKLVNAQGQPGRVSSSVMVTSAARSWIIYLKNLKLKVLFFMLTLRLNVK